MTTSGASHGVTEHDARDPKSIVRDGYDRASHAYRGDEFDATEFPRSGYAHWIKRLATRIEPGARVLDLGCGNGVPAAQELARRYAVTGVDISPVQIERARELVPSAAFVCADMTEIQFEPGSFEAVVAFFSIIHIPRAEQPALIERMASWLAPGGWVLAIVGKVAWEGTETNWRRVAGLPMWYSHADVATYRTWFAAAGLAITEEGSEPERGVPGYSVLIAQRGKSLTNDAHPPSD